MELECVRGGRRLFRGLGFRLAAGEMLQVCGDNGSGKTSLLRIICGLHRPEGGEVRWGGLPIGDRRGDYQGALAYLGHQYALKGALTAPENLAAAAALWSHPPAHPAAHALCRVGLENYLHLPCGALSAGQRLRVALARVIHHGGPLWILDEPASALDPAATDTLEAMLTEHIAGGGMAVFTSHRALALRGVQRRHLTIEGFAP